MFLSYVLWVVAVMQLANHVCMSSNHKEWAGKAQKSISEAGLFFTRANMGLANLDKNKMPKLFGLAKHAGKLAGVFGTVGALFGVIMAFIPGGESPEIRLMKEKF